MVIIKFTKREKCQLFMTNIRMIYKLALYRKFWNLPIWPTGVLAIYRIHKNDHKKARVRSS